MSRITRLSPPPCQNLYGQPWGGLKNFGMGGQAFMGGQPLVGGGGRGSPKPPTRIRQHCTVTWEVGLTLLFPSYLFSLLKWHLIPLNFKHFVATFAFFIFQRFRVMIRLILLFSGLSKQMVNGCHHHHGRPCYNLTWENYHPLHHHQEYLHYLQKEFPNIAQVRSQKQSSW